jgi:UDP-N-acetyl-D-galactosamine dehydrogenase
METKKLKLAIIGMGYVGLPLAIEFSKKRKVLGFDIKKKRIEELRSGVDKTLEVPKKKILNNKNLILTLNKKKLKKVNCYIVTVPTPVNNFKKPDLKPLIDATKIISEVLKKGDLVIYESTVYPGCTEELCVPILEKKSKLKFNIDFFCGYSPERNNPGDKKKKLINIKKITSGSTPQILNLVDKLYKEIIVAGTHRAPSIKVAEAAKIIENIQRDLNIGLINELSILLNKLNIDTEEVLVAAESKWNFIPFRPGLVGGHCIAVDPYYLIHKAKMMKYRPNIILSARKVNNNMGLYIASNLIKEMKKKFIKIENSKVLIMGLTFKQNCPDLRNSGVFNVIKELKKHKCSLDFYDPWANKNQIKKIYGKLPISKLKASSYDGIIVAVSHDLFKSMCMKITNLKKNKNSIIYDLKHIFPKKYSDLRL